MCVLHFSLDELLFIDKSFRFLEKFIFFKMIADQRTHRAMVQIVELSKVSKTMHFATTKITYTIVQQVDFLELSDLETII